MKLTFVKRFDVYGAGGSDMASLIPCTIEGEVIDDVLSCSVEQTLGGFPKMTIEIHVKEKLSENIAAKFMQK